MAKTAKKISISTFDKIAKEYQPNEISVPWEGIEVQITRTLSLKQTLEFVNNVVQSCFQEDGSFIPEVMDFAIKSNILTKYANFSLPENLEHRYNLIYGTDAVGLVCGQINKTQMDEIITSIEKKIEYLCNSSAMTIQKRMSELLDALEQMGKQTEDLFSGLSGKELSALVSAVGDGGVDEEKLAKSYLTLMKGGFQKEKTDDPD